MFFLDSKENRKIIRISLKSGLITLIFGDNKKVIKKFDMSAGSSDKQLFESKMNNFKNFGQLHKLMRIFQC